MEKTPHKFWGYLVLWIIAVGIVAAVVKFSMQAVDKVEEIEKRCSAMCDPYVVESCGVEARTATCRTVKGYFVREMNEDGTVVSVP